MATIFWDVDGVILLDFFSRRATTNFETYIEILQKLRARIQQARPNMEVKKVLLYFFGVNKAALFSTRI